MPDPCSPDRRARSHRRSGLLFSVSALNERRHFAAISDSAFTSCAHGRSRSANSRQRPSWTPQEGFPHRAPPPRMPLVAGSTARFGPGVQITLGLDAPAGHPAEPPRCMSSTSRTSRTP